MRYVEANPTAKITGQAVAPTNSAYENVADSNHGARPTNQGGNGDKSRVVRG